MNTDDTIIDLERLLTTPRSTKLENQLTKNLRNMPEDEAYLIIDSLVSNNVKLGFLFAKKTLRSKRYIIKLFLHGFYNADASGMQYVLDCSVSKLGFKKVSSLLKEYKDECPDCFDKALYWMSRFLPEGEPDSSRILADLKKCLRE